MPPSRPPPKSPPARALPSRLPRPRPPLAPCPQPSSHGLAQGLAHGSHVLGHGLHGAGQQASLHPDSHGQDRCSFSLPRTVYVSHSVYGTFLHTVCVSQTFSQTVRQTCFIWVSQTSFQQVRCTSFMTHSVTGRQTVTQ